MLSEYHDSDLDERREPVLFPGDESNRVERPAPAPVVTIPVRLVAAAPEPVAATPRMVRVRVLANYRVLHDRKPYVGGDVLSVPEDKANQWIKARIVEPIKTRRK